MANTEMLIKYLQEWLERNEVAPVDLARRAGLASPSLYDILNGNTQNPKPITLQKLATAMGEAPETLYERAGIAITDVRPRSERVRRMVALLDDLPESDQDALLIYAKALVEDRKKRERQERDKPDKVGRLTQPANR